jgi:3-methyladenine DNA glycosylase Tag
MSNVNVSAPKKNGTDGNPEEQDSSVFHNVIPGEHSISDAGYLELLSYAVFTAALGDSATVEENWPEILYVFKSFHVQRVAEFTANDLHDVVQRVPMLQEKPQLSAIVANASALLQISQVYGSFKQYLRSFEKDGPAELLKDVAERFTMVDPAVFQEFLKSAGAKILIPDTAQPNKGSKQNRPPRRGNRPVEHRPAKTNGQNGAGNAKPARNVSKPPKAEQADTGTENGQPKNRRSRKRRFGFRKKKPGGNTAKGEKAAVAPKES